MVTLVYDFGDYFFVRNGADLGKLFERGYLADVTR